MKEANHSIRRLNSLILDNSYKKYLEIGISRGVVFREISCERKTGVDPNFLFDYRSYNELGTSLHEMTSDEYFSTGLEIGEAFDLIFVDGLHTFEQTLCDLLNSMEVLAPGGTILLDDTIPIDAHSAIRSQAEAVRARQNAGLRGQFWHGDVYKLVFFVNDFLRHWEYVTIVGGGNPQTLIWRRNSISCRPKIFNRIKDIDEMSYENFNELRGKLSEADERTALMLRKSLEI